MAPAQAIPKDSLITKDLSKEYKSENILQEIYEPLTTKSAFQDGIYSEYFLGQRQTVDEWEIVRA